MTRSCTGRLKRSLSQNTKTYLRKQNEEIKHRQKSRLSSKVCLKSLPYPLTADKLFGYHCKNQTRRNCTEKYSSSGSVGF
jgi:hypothetical protein